MAICGGEPINACTKIVMTGCTVRVLSCAISKTINRALRPADPVNKLMLGNNERLLLLDATGVNSSVTTAQTKARPAQVIPAHQKNGAR